MHSASLVKDDNTQNFSLFYNVCGAINILFELAANAFFSISFQNFGEKRLL